ncbi:MAG: oligosaccharide flippase family protein [Planctomycetes bacterium]|nr:oligosaccharide flippase family protein [Planctomycetota bacterium]
MLKNIGAQWFRQVIFIVVGVIVPPLMNAYLGKATYGAWELVMSTTGLMKILALGVPLATVRTIAARAAKKDQAGLDRTIGTSMAIFIAIGLLALVAGGGLYLFFEWNYVPRIEDPADVGPARIAFAIITVQVALSFAMQLPYSILAGHHDFMRQNRIMIMILLIRSALIVTTLLNGGSLMLLAVIELFATTLEFLIPWRSLRRFYPHLSLSPRNFDRAEMKDIFSFGGYVVLLHIGIRLAFQTDSLVIGKWMTPEAVNEYARANTFLIYLIELMIGVGGVIMPMAARLQAEDRLRELESVFLKWSKITFSLGLLVGLYLLVLGPEFVAWWMHDDSFYRPAQEVIPALMISAFVFLPIRAVAMPMLLGLGRVKAPAMLFLANGLINLGISIALVGPWGLFGVALGTAIPNFAYALIVLVLACRSIDGSVARWCAYVLPRCLLGALPVLAFLYGWRRHFAPRDLVGLAVPGLLAVGLFGLIWVFFVHRADPQLDILARLRQRRRGKAA